MELTVLWLVVLHAWLFVLGACVGSFLNVCIYRLPRGKPLSWPGSRCGSCFTKIPPRENIPILGYWMLGGRCPRCQATFSMRYFAVELFTGLVFVALFTAEIGSNSLAYKPWAGNWWRISFGGVPDDSVAVYLAHATLASLLIVCAGTLLDTGRVPWAVVVFGVLSGLAFSLFVPAYFVPGGGLLGIIAVPTLLRLLGAPQGVVAVALVAGGFVGWQMSLAALAVAAPFLMLRKDGAVFFALAVAAVWQARGVLPFKEGLP
jgi:leader peptidase (prepilin peptidase)/N-methyltransferase